MEFVLWVNTLVEERHQSDHRELRHKALRIARPRRDSRHGVTAPLQLGQGLMHMRQDFEPLRPIELGNEVSERQLQVLGPQRLRQTEIHIVAGE
jgi:hypothetical protein